MSRAYKEDPERIFPILQELYGCSESYVTLQEFIFLGKKSGIFACISLFDGKDNCKCT